MEKLAYSPRELIKLLSLSKNNIYRLLQTGDLKSVRVGGRILIPRQAVEEFLSLPGKN